MDVTKFGCLFFQYVGHLQYSYMMHGTMNIKFTSVVISEEYSVMVNLEELIGTTEYMTLYKVRMNRCRYSRGV
jgi:hypothetical protein